MIDMDNVMLGDIGLGSPLLTKLQAMPSLFGGLHDQEHGSASAHIYVCPSSSASVNDNIYLHDADQLSSQQAIHHTLSHDIRMPPFDSSSASPPLSHAHLPGAVVDDATLVNLLSRGSTTSTGLSCRQVKGGQEETTCLPCAYTSMAHYLSTQGSFGCSVSTPFEALARHLQYFDPCQVASESFQREDNIVIASDVQDSNTSGSVNCMVNRSGHNVVPPKAALSSSTSTSTSSTPSNIPNGHQLAQLAKETLQAWMAYDASSFSGKSSALININSTSMVNEGANRKRTGMSANSTEQKKRRKKRRRISHKNVEEMETQRMTHITVERNRRKQMNEHLRALRSLMPQSYIQRGDQASIVGGTIRFVEELEQVLQSLRLQKQLRAHCIEDYGSRIGQNHELLESPVDEIYANKQSCTVNVEVTMLTSKTIFLKVLAQRKPHQLLDTLLAISNLSLKVIHLNIATIGLIIVYSFNLEMDNSDECQLLTPCELAESLKHTLCV